MDNKIDKKQTEIDALLDLEYVEIQPLAEEDLDSVAGGGCASLWCCSNG